MSARMKRREFMTLLGGAAAAPVFAPPSRAQQNMPVVGFLNSGLAAENAHLAHAFRQGLGEAGFADGKDVTIEYRWSDSQYDRLPALAADLVRRQVAAIIVNTPAAPVAKAATSRIPIIFSIGLDPVAAGLVASLNRPGGNLTGITSLNVELGPKLLEVLKEALPKATRFGLLINPTTPNAPTLSKAVQAAARTLELDLHMLHASSEREFDEVFARLRQLGAAGVVIGADAFLRNQSERLAGLALKHAMPAISPFREFAAAGGLMSYGGSTTEQFRLVGVYTGRVLKGEKPAELPVHQVTKVDLVANLKTAKTLGITFPLPLIGRADEVIE
jgi:putative ABC transport system substrate-binding protein